ELLASCYRESLALAAAEGFASLAFPAISTGVYGYPKDRAALVALAAIRGFMAASPKPDRVWLVFYTEADALTLLEAAEA
ncbi:MAG TPA: macro domain-containing protein, partial [Rectinemataceae bacterium]|nr:macro domain-containing protein [Rectinemataceae bacterium]